MRLLNADKKARLHRNLVQRAYRTKKRNESLKKAQTELASEIKCLRLQNAELQRENEGLKARSAYDSTNNPQLVQMPSSVLPVPETRVTGQVNELGGSPNLTPDPFTSTCSSPLPFRLDQVFGSHLLPPVTGDSEFLNEEVETVYFTSTLPSIPSDKSLFDIVNFSPSSSCHSSIRDTGHEEDPPESNNQNFRHFVSASKSGDVGVDDGLDMDDIPMQLVPLFKIAAHLLLGRNGIKVDLNVLRRLLFQASEKGDEMAVRMLLSRYKLDPNSKGVDGLTPLMVAAENGHKALVQLLLGRRDINPNPADNRGRTPTWYAAQKGHHSVVRLLLERNDVDPNANDHVDGRTPLMIAAQNGHEEVVRLLLERDNVDPNFPNRSGETPLWCAAWFGYTAVVQLLLTRDGVDADPKNERGETLLWSSASNGHCAVVQLLLQRDDVDPNPQRDGLTLLMVAARNGHEAVVRLLLSRDDVSLDIRGPYGWTALTFAAHRGHEAAVRLLLERNNVDVDKALSFAAYEGHEVVVRLLLERNDVEPKSRDNALRLAMQGGHEAVIRRALGCNAH